MKKANEMEKSHVNKSASITLIFYNLSLFIYSVYLMATKGELGIPFNILMVGQIIFFGSNLAYKKYTK